MKQFIHYAVAGAMLLCPGAQVFGAVPFQKGKTAPKPRIVQTVRDRHNAPQSSTVVNEDFSKFAEGSEENPADMIVNPDRYFISEELTAQPGWTGMGLHPAGGCALISSYMYDPYGYGAEPTNGYISTPPMYLGGTSTITFKAKARTEGAELWVSMCDDYYGPSDSESFFPTDQWQEYTFVTSEGSLDDNSYVQFTAMDLAEVFIDDIRIDYVRDRISSPYAMRATNVSATEFIANWEETGAPEYLLTVYSIIPNPNPETGTLTENFDGITPDDATNMNIPEGWQMTFGGKAVTREAGQFASAPQALVFDDITDLIESPELPMPLTKLSFWTKPSSMEQEEYEMSLLRVEVYHSETETWEAIAHIPNLWMEPEGAPYELVSEQFGTDVTKVRLGLVQKNLVEFYVDDLVLEYSSGGIRKDIMTDKPFTASGVTVKDIDPAANTFYFVKASDDGIISPASNKIWVDGINGLTVNVGETTDITATSFTANWEQLGHSTSYKVDCYSITSANEDIDEVTVLEESFDNITEGTVEAPGTDYSSPFDFGAKGWASTGWCATQPAWANGMAGTTGTSWFGTAGLVYSPVLDLSCNNGEGFDVEMSVYTTVADLSNVGVDEAEGVFAIVIKSPNDPQSLAYGLLETPVVGLTSGKVHVDTRRVDDLSNVYVAFMNKSGRPFFVDHVKITQPLKKGDELCCPLKIVNTESTSYTFTGLDPKSDHGFIVTGSTKYDYENYESVPTEMCIVRTTTGVENVSVADDTDSTVTSDNGIIAIAAADNTTWHIYTPAGILVKAGTGSASVAATSGLYIVRLGTRTVKLLVK